VNVSRWTPVVKPAVTDGVVASTVPPADHSYESVVAPVPTPESVTSAVPSAPAANDWSGPAFAVGGGTGGRYSNAPMSTPSPEGRRLPSKSTPGAFVSVPASIMGLVGCR
jgi:hypothetical protein